LISVVTVVDVGLMVLVVVVLQRLLRHVGLEGIVGIGQVVEGEGHDLVSLGGARASAVRRAIAHETTPFT
jgi:6,7-dimethyl-8-ribityllumazine synthase